MEIQIIICGDTSVGRTCFIDRYINNIFCEYSHATIGVNLMCTRKNINGLEVKLRFIDITAQHSYRSFVPLYFRNVDGIIYAYDVYIQNWAQLVKDIGKQDTESILIGTKIDIMHYQEVPLCEGDELAKELKIGFFETSAKDGRNVQNSIEYLVQRIISKNLQQQLLEQKNNKNVNLNTSVQRDEQKQRCYL